MTHSCISLESSCFFAFCVCPLYSVTLVNRASMTTPAGVDYIRVKLLQCTPDDKLKVTDELFDPYVVVHVLEAQNEPGQSSHSCLLNRCNSFCEFVSVS